jgi:hypothetical protein
MTLLLLLSGLGLLLVPAFARPIGRRLPPAEWAKTAAGLLAAGALVVEVSLAIQATPTVLRAAGLSHVADLCEHALRTLTPGGTPVGVGAAMAAVVLPVLTSRALLRARRARRTIRVDPEVGWHGQVHGHDLVVLPTGEPVAFSTGGRPGQVVVSRGLIQVLTDDQLAAVLRHEVAHVRHGHQRYLLLARAIEWSLGRLPFVRRGTAAVCCAVERWADEEAAGGGATGRASVQAALLRVAQVRAAPEVAAFTSPGTLLERLEALDTDPAGGLAVVRRSFVYLPAVLLLLAAAVAFGGILEHAWVRHLLAGLCPPH